MTRNSKRDAVHSRALLRGMLAVGVACFGAVSGAAAAPTPGEICRATRSFSWISATSGYWSGCTPDAEDDFHANGFRVFVERDLEIHGDIVADAGGRIAVRPGITLRAAGALGASSGGTLELTGRRLFHGRVTRVSWSARSAEIEAGPWVTDILRPGNMLHVLDDYGDAIEPLAPTFQTRPGPPSPGLTRPSYARGWMFRVTAVNAQSFSVSLDDWNGQGRPYVGRRGIGGTGIGVAAARMLNAFHGIVSELRLDPASLQVVDGDLSEQYVELSAGPCVGKLAKIVGTRHATDGQGDFVYVAGPWLSEDQQSCGSGPAWISIHIGLRPGDPIAVYRVARVDGLGTGYIEIRDGHIEADRFDLQNLGFFNKRSVVPALDRHANVIFRHADNCATPGAGFMRRGNIGNFRVPSPESDIGVIYGAAHSYRSTWRGCGTFDLSHLVQFDQLAIHDTWSSDPNGTGGSHGFYSDGVGMHATRLVVARVTDDGIGGHLSGFESEPQPFVIEDARVFGVLPDVDKSAECFEPGADNVVDPRTGMNEQQRARGMIVARDLTAIGCSTETVSVAAYGATLDRVVAAGANLLGGPYIRALFSVAVSTVLQGVTGNPLDDPLNQAQVREALVLMQGGAQGGMPFVVAGRCEGCIVVGDVGRAPNTRLGDVTDYDRSFLHFTNAWNVFDDVNVTPWRRTQLELRDTVILSETASSLAGPHTHLASYRVVHSALGLGAASNLLSGLETAAASWIDGIVGTSAGPARALSIGVPAGGVITDPCLETTFASDPEAFGGAELKGEVVRSSAVGPDALAFAPLAAYATDPARPGLCDHAVPAGLGLSAANIGRAHADLGDLFLDHPEFWSADLAGAAAP